MTRPVHKGHPRGSRNHSSTDLRLTALQRKIDRVRKDVQTPAVHSYAGTSCASCACRSNLSA
eukprot:scaffold175_cov414-Prasinococcus_capsulatus_cf.AAC.53